MDFVQTLAQRIQAIVPEGFSITPDQGMMKISRVNDLPTWNGMNADDPAAAALSILSAVQDYVSIALTVPWPSLALPEVSIEGSTLRMRLGPITLDDIDLSS